MDEKYRYLLRFSKQGSLCFIGHLDLLRVFQQTIRRAGLPVAYSQGFNPHQLLSFALPLPVGMASENDYAEVYFTTPVDTRETLTALNARSPAGLAFSLVKYFPDGAGVAARAYAADYEWRADVPESAAAELIGRREIIIPKKTKSGVKDTDVRPDIYALNYKPGAVIMRLSAGSRRFINPLTVAGLLSGGEAEQKPADNTSGEAGNNSAAASPESINPGQFIRKELYRLEPDGSLAELSRLGDGNAE